MPCLHCNRDERDYCESCGGSAIEICAELVELASTCKPLPPGLVALAERAREVISRYAEDSEEHP